MGTTYDICPKGWRLPTGGNSGELALYNNAAYNSWDGMRAPISEGGAAFALAGMFSQSNSPFHQGEYGVYWSSTRPDAPGYMSTLTLQIQRGYPSIYASINEIIGGFSIRCILKS